MSQVRFPAFPRIVGHFRQVADPLLTHRQTLAAREMGHLSLSNALSLCVLYRREQDPRFERAARRWVRRVQVEHSLRLQEVDLLRGAMAALGSRFGRVALTALLGTCRELRLVPPTLAE